MRKSELDLIRCDFFRMDDSIQGSPGVVYESTSNVTIINCIHSR